MDDLESHSRVMTKKTPSPFYIGAGDVDFETVNLMTIEFLGQLAVFLHGVAKDIHDDRHLMLLKEREFFAEKGLNPHVLKTDCVEHPGRGFHDAWGWVAFDGV